MNFITTLLSNLNYGSAQIQEIIDIAVSLVTKIGTIVISLSLAMTSSIAPHIAGNYARQDYKGVNDKLRQVVSIVLVIAVPMAVGIILLAPQVYYVFFGLSEYGPRVLRVAIAYNVISCTTAVFSTALQSMNHGKQVCFFTLIAIALNIAMDLPLMYLFNRLGLPPYLGANLSSILSELVLLALQLRTLYVVVHFDYRKAFTIIRQIRIPLVAMMALVGILKILIPVPLVSRWKVLALLFLYAGLGAALYFFLCYRSGALQNVFDKEVVDSLLAKLGRGRKNEEN